MFKIYYAILHIYAVKYNLNKSHKYISLKYHVLKTE